MKKKNKKEEIEINPYFEKIHKEVKRSYYDYDKIFIGYMSALTKCDTQKEIQYLKNTATEGLKDAPDELVVYFNESVKNKIKGLFKKEDIDLIKLRLIAKSH